MRWPNILGFGVIREKAGDDGSDGGGGNPKGGDPESKGSKNTGKVDIDGEEVDLKDVRGAVSLYRALQDPETGSEIIETLARKAGLLDKKGDLKEPTESKTKQAGKIRKALEAKLGKEYGKFSSEVGDTLDEAIQEYLNELKESSRGESSADKWSSEVDKFTESHTLTKEIETTMQEIMADSPPNTGGKNFNAQKYLDRMYKAAIDELEIEAPKPKKSARSKSQNDDDDVPDFRVAEAPKHYTLDDAIDAAMKGIRFRRRDE